MNPATLAAPSPPVFVLFKNLPGIEAVDDVSTGPRTCHDCHLTLVPRVVNGTTIDICPRCGNVWLGVGEFDRVAEFYRSHPKTEWPRASQLEAQPVLPDGSREKSGLPRGAKAAVGKPFVRLPGENEPESPAERMRRATELIRDLVDKGLAE